MLLRIATTHQPATDLGFLLHKHPDRVQAFELPFGTAHVFYPQADEERCEFALLLEVDAVGLTRGRKKWPGGAVGIGQYVNDRPYASSSFMSVAIARVLRSAMAGKGGDRQALADSAIPLDVRISALPSREGPEGIEALFRPLGYEVQSEQRPLDAAFPQWGPSHHHAVRLQGELRLQDMLRHLYVLIPVLDDYKHYWVSRAEIDKLLAMGEGWLEDHPRREDITRRYLRHQHGLATEALARLVAEDDPDVDRPVPPEADPEALLERPIRLHDQRLGAVVEALEAQGASKILDLGCGEGRLVGMLLRKEWARMITGVDVSVRALERAARRLRLHELAPPVRERVELLHGSAVYRDERFSGHDAIVATEVVEHFDPSRLSAFERVVFEHAGPRCVIITTPNREHNALFPGLADGAFRHPDHRFEWTREEFAEWSDGMKRFGYSWTHHPIGEEAEGVGAPSQMGVFTRDG